MTTGGADYGVYLVRNLSRLLWSCGRCVAVLRVHEIVQKKHAQLVTLVVERVGRKRAATPYTEHVHVGRRGRPHELD